MFKLNLKHLILAFIAALILPSTRVTAQVSEWLTYADPVAGYAFDYPATAHLSTGDDAAQGYQAVFVQSDQAPGYQGYAVVVFNNAANEE